MRISANKNDHENKIQEFRVDLVRKKDNLDISNV